VRKRSKFCLETNESLFQKNERKFGEFNLNFRVPDEYEKKWSSVSIENGIMTLRYQIDPGEERESERGDQDDWAGSEGEEEACE
jgi:HSP20 family molecular chaperone IbpA